MVASFTTSDPESKKVPKEQLHREPVVRSQHKSWVKGMVVGGVEESARECQSLLHFKNM